MKLISLFFLVMSFNCFAQITTTQPYEVKEENKDYEIKENSGLNKFQRVGRNERAIQELYQRIEVLEKMVKELQTANQKRQ